MYPTRPAATTANRQHAGQRQSQMHACMQARSSTIAPTWQSRLEIKRTPQSPGKILAPLLNCGTDPAVLPGWMGPGLLDDILATSANDTVLLGCCLLVLDTKQMQEYTSRTKIKVFDAATFSTWNFGLEESKLLRQ